MSPPETETAGDVGSPAGSNSKQIRPITNNTNSFEYKAENEFNPYPQGFFDVWTQGQRDAWFKKESDAYAAKKAAQQQAYNISGGYGRDKDTSLETKTKSYSKKKKTSSRPDNWLSEAIKDDHDNPIPNVANCLLALRNAPELYDCFAYDEMMRTVYVVGPLPLANGGVSNTAPSPEKLGDHHTIQLQEWLQKNGLHRVGSLTVRDAIYSRAMERKYHPVKDYLESLEWDQKPRLDNWLHTYFGVEATDYSMSVGRMFLISMIARIYQQGCKVDYTLILEGEQGLMKSAACRTLGGDWFSDTLPDIGNGKDVSQHLRGKWLIEIAEMAAMSKTEAAHLKAFLTRTVEQYRPPYGREEIYEPRQCVFIATTNESAYLKDATGGRRFWPVIVTKVENDLLAQDRDQIFAEALTAYRSGEHWWPDQKFELNNIKPQQEARREVDEWDAAIGDYLATNLISRVTIGELATNALFFEIRNFGTSEQRRVAGSLQRLGWKRSTVTIRGKHPWIAPNNFVENYRRNFDHCSTATFSGEAEKGVGG